MQDTVSRLLGVVVLGAGLVLSWSCDGDGGIELEGDDPGECDDGADNDGDTLIDCDDTDCAADLACQRNGIYEVFDVIWHADPIDLAGHSITFTPDAGEPAGYAWETGDGVAELPHAVGSGTATETLDLGNDEAVEYDFVNLPEFELFGIAYASVFVSSNGCLTFGEGSSSTPDNDPAIDLESFFSLPIVAGLRRDLDPTLPSTAGDPVITIDDSAERLVVTFQNVPRRYGADPPRPNDFQMVLGADRSIALYYLSIDAPGAIVGIAAGDAVGVVPDETNFIDAVPEACDDAVDNDGDTLIDCDDPDCFGVAPCNVAESNCADGEDNDSDALIDCDDPDCFSVAPCNSVELICADGEDNDSDALIDCDDPDCFGVAPCNAAELNCTDGADNDGDTLVDCDDSDCAADLACQRRGIYEVFDVIWHADPIDLTGHSITFTPDVVEPAGYAWETGDGVAELPHAVGSGTTTETLVLGNDEAVEYDFVNLPEFELFGIAYASVFVSSNGCLTFGEGSSATPNIDPAIDLEPYFSLPIVAGLRRDLDPTLPSTAGDPVITIDDSAERLVVTFQNVPRRYGADPTGPNDFQMVLGADGSIALHYLAIDVPGAIVGIAAGDAEGLYPDETNFIEVDPEGGRGIH